MKLLSVAPIKGLATLLPHRSLKRWPIPPNFKDIVMPENRKLTLLEPVPQWPAMVKALKYQKRLYDMRGPELIHNHLLYKQYGIMALSGGQLRPGHLNMIRNTVNKGLDINRMFAAWRIDPPWKPITRKGQGKRMGGGKGSISFYVTPVRAGRVILEVGGTCEFEEVLFFLQDVVWKLPFDAMAIDQNTLQDLKQEEEEVSANNINPISFEYAIKNNMRGCKSWISPYDEIWYGKYV